MSKNQNDHGVCSLCSTPLEAYAWRLRCQTPGCYTAGEGGVVEHLQGIAASAAVSDAAFEQMEAAISAQFEVARGLRADFKAAVEAAVEQRLAERNAELETARAKNQQLETDLEQLKADKVRLMRDKMDLEQTVRDLQETKVVA